MFRVTIDNSQFETWANVKLPENIMAIMNQLATEVEAKLEATQFSRPTGKTLAALSKIQHATRSGDIFESGVGNMSMVGAGSDTSAPPETIRSFKDWLRGQLA